MVKEIEVQLLVPGCTAKEYYAAIYGDAEAIRVFHAKQNNDHNVKVDAWRDGRRVVEFTMQMNVPAMLKKVIGMDAVPVVENQVVSWQGQSEFTLSSEPVLNFPGANKFTTSGFLTVREQQDGCLVTCCIRCSAAMPWPMQSTVEGLMGTEALASINVFLEFCKEYYITWSQRRKQAQAQPQARGAAAAGASGRASQPQVDGDDVFYDFSDDENAAGELGASGEDAADEVVPYQPQRLEDIIVLALHQIQKSTADTAASLQQLEQLMRSIDSNIEAMRTKVAGPPPRRHGAGSAAAAAGPAVVSRQPGASAGSWLPTLLSVAALASAASYGYLRYKQYQAQR